MMRYRFYTTIDELPIWHWDKCVDTNDVRYLMKLKDYDRLPKIHKYAHRDLLRNYSSLVKQFDVSQSPIVKAKKQVMLRIIDIILEVVKTSKDVEKIRKASTILRALMIDSSHEEFIWNVDFLETSDQKQMLTLLAIEVKKYNEKVKRQKGKKVQTLVERIARIESGLGVTINAKECSVSQFLAYSKEYVTKVNSMNKQIN